MKKVLLIFAVLLIGVAFVTTTFAQEKPAAAPEKTVKAVKPAKGKKGMSGEVVKIDVTENVIVIKGKKGEEVYDIKDTKWKVYKGAEEVKAGDYVVITSMDMDGKKVAKKIMKAKKPAGKKAAAKKEEAKPAAPAPAPAK